MATAHPLPSAIRPPRARDACWFAAGGGHTIDSFGAARVERLVTRAIRRAPIGD